MKGVFPCKFVGVLVVSLALFAVALDFKTKIGEGGQMNLNDHTAARLILSFILG